MPKSSEATLSPLEQFRSRLEESHPEPATFQPLLRQLEAAGLLEAALQLLKRRHPRPVQGRGTGWTAVRARMELGVARSREKRMAVWQQDPQRRLLRLRFEVRTPATSLNPHALAGALAQAFLAAGLPIAMGLEKSPRPVLALGHPLPLGVEGLQEWADATLKSPLAITDEAAASVLNHHLPQGVRILDLQEVPVISTPVLELCVVGRWSWPCPEPLRPHARERLEAFLAAETFTLEKSGKVGGQKTVKRVDVRDRVLEAGWEGPVLWLETRLSAGLALNPQKLLAALVGLPPAEVTSLIRESVRLAEDPKLADPYRYETKLSNLYEDAVLLDSPAPTRNSSDREDDTLLL